MPFNLEDELLQALLLACRKAFLLNRPGFSEPVKHLSPWLSRAGCARALLILKFISKALIDVSAYLNIFLPICDLQLSQLGLVVVKGFSSDVSQNLVFQLGCDRDVLL